MSLKTIANLRLTIMILIIPVSAAILVLTALGGLPLYFAIWPAVGGVLLYGNFVERREDNKQLASTIVNEAMELVDKNLFRAAREHLKLAIKLSPDYYGIHMVEGVICRNEQQFDLAQKELNLAVKANPNSYRSYFALGLTCLQAKKVVATIAAFRGALRVRPDKWEVYFILAQAYELDGDKIKAVENYKKYVELAGSTIEAQMDSKIKEDIKNSRMRILELQ